MLVIKRNIALARRKIIIVGLLATATALGAGLFVYLTEGEGAAPAKVLQLAGRGRRVAWSPDGKTLAVVMIYEPLFSEKRGSALMLWDVEKGEVRGPLAESTLPGLSFPQVVFSLDGKGIAAAVTEGPGRVGNEIDIEDVLKFWDAKTLTYKQMLGKGAKYQIACFAFSPDGKLVVAGDPGKKLVMLWNTETSSLERTLQAGAAQPWSLAFSPDGKTLVIGGLNDDRSPELPNDINRVSGQIQWWDAQTWTLKRVVKQDRDVRTIAFSANGKLLASGGTGELVQLWDAQTGELIHSLQGLGSGTRSVAFSPDSQTVAAGGKDGKVRLWDVRTGKLKATLKEFGWGLPGASEIYSLAFSPDGKILASASQDQRVRLWKMPAPASPGR
jgi:WD40 repeat protein